MANGISKCFIAGTLVCTVNGLMAIENNYIIYCDKTEDEIERIEKE